MLLEPSGLDFGSILMDFGRVLGRIWKLLGPLGSFWNFFKMLVFGMVFKSALGAVWPGFRFDCNGFGEDLGRVLGGFWEGLGRMCEHSG